MWTDTTMMLKGGFVETLSGQSAALAKFPSRIPEWKRVQKQTREILELSLAAVREVLGITERLPEVNIPESITVLLRRPAHVRELFSTHLKCSAGF